MLKFAVPDMSCGHCVGSVTKAIMNLDSAARVEVDLPNKTVSVETTADAAVVSKAIEAAGYTNALA